MDRNPTEFPDDPNGNSLWNLVVEGDDLSKVRDVEFSVAFETEDEALKFGEILLFYRQQVLIDDNEDSKSHPYDVIVTVAMAPNYKEITEYERLLAEYANDLNGVNDGWGCYAFNE